MYVKTGEATLVAMHGRCAIHQNTDRGVVISPISLYYSFKHWGCDATPSLRFCGSQVERFKER